MTMSAPSKDPNDNSASGPGGGAMQSNDADAVWRQELTPQERALLQQYFK
jgi:hypothetical protein